ncbi:MAG: leucine-rich repeat protein, partial [Clostridia bacterium]|nr:leucine-rich repeat protein [Clostridia bacterium]
MKKKLLMFFLIVAAIMSMLVLTSCEQLLRFLNGETGENEGEPPTIVGLETIKAEPGYLESDEYLYNSQGTNPMAVSRSEKYYLVIHYNNKEKYPIHTVKVTWKDGETKQTTSHTFKADSFAEGSNETATYLAFSTEEEVKSGTIEYTVNSVMYTSGSSTPKMDWESKDVSRSITVATRPAIKLTLKYMNEDKRKGYSAKAQEETKEIYYKSEIKSQLNDADYTGETQNLPTRAGGWVFTGWYTEPLGKGLLISGKDDAKFVFWSDTTLYANYERMYDIELTDIDEITHTYKEGGSDQQIKFTTGAVLKNSGKNNQESVRSNYKLEVPDTVFIDNYTITQTTREDGMPKYEYTLTGHEYPVVRLGTGTFVNFNTIKDATIGKYVQEIGYAAFQGCTKMETLVFNEGSRLKYIGDYAFEKTEALGDQYTFTLPDSVEYLGMCAFRDSTWSKNKTDGTASGSTTLYIPATWKYIGYKCFFHTRFTRVVFRPGCYFESQISFEEGKNDESATGSKTIRYGQNRIGASIFGMCYYLRNVTFETDPGKNNGLNIIPECCFDAGSWYDNADKRDGNFACIQNVSFAEGLKYIGKEAFNYQVKIPELCLPKTLEEIGARAFYNCIAVTNLNFEHVDRETLDREGVNKALTKDSQLRIIRHCAFSNLRNIDVVYITSEN